MFAVSPSPFISTTSWALEDLIIPQYYHQENDNSSTNICTSRETENSDALLFPSPSSSCARNNGERPIFGVPEDGVDSMNMSKKSSHNANERDRRKRVNNMYSDLRSLLPAADQAKRKLSIPETVSEVLKYIPQLQMEVEELIHEKEKLLSNISKKEEVRMITKKRNFEVMTSSPSTISVSPLGEREVLIQISAAKALDKKLLFEILEHLEENGLLLLNASSFESSGDRAFNSLHLQVQDNHKVESDILQQKLLLLYEKTKAQLP